MDKIKSKTLNIYTHYNKELNFNPANKKYYDAQIKDYFFLGNPNKINSLKLILDTNLKDNNKGLEFLILGPALCKSFLKDIKIELIDNINDLIGKNLKLYVDEKSGKYLIQVP